ncbi:hypothetical protein RI367_005552 [Sorochytrium milnesiophthora]
MADTPTDISQLVRSKLSCELRQHVLAYCGPVAVVACRSLFPFRRLLQSHLASGSRNIVLGTRLAAICIDYGWRQGLEELILADLFPGRTDMSRINIDRLERMSLCAAAVSRFVECYNYICSTDINYRDEAFHNVGHTIVYIGCARSDSPAELRALLRTQRWSGVLALAVKHRASMSHIEELIQHMGQTCSGHLQTELAQSIVQHGRSDLCSWLVELYAARFDNRLAQLALAGGYVDMALFIKQHARTAVVFDTLRPAVAAGQLSTLQWLYEQGARHLGSADINKAAERGHLAVLQFLHTHQLGTLNALTADAAAAGGQMHVLQWLHDVCQLKSTMIGFTGAVRAGHLHVVRWCVTKLGTHFHADAMAMLSLSHGHLEMAQWFNSRRSEPDSPIRTFDGEVARFPLSVLNYGDLLLVQWTNAHTAGLDQDLLPRAVQRAVDTGSLDLVCWLHESFPDAVADIMCRAALQGYVGIVRWAHAQLPACSNKCDRALGNAVIVGHLPVLQYLQQCCQGRCSTFAIEDSQYDADEFGQEPRKRAVLAFVREHYPEVYQDANIWLAMG